MNLSHDEIRDLLPDYERGGLDAGQRRTVEQHLLGCGECSAELRLLEELRAVPVPDPGPEFWKTLVPAASPVVRPEKTFAQTVREFLGQMLSPLPVAAAAAFAVMLVTAPALLDRLPSGHGTADPLVASVLYDDELSAIEPPAIVIDDAAYEEYSSEGKFSDSSYDREFASMDDEEIAALEAMLTTPQSGG